MPPKCGKSVGNVFIVLLYIAIGSVYYTFIHLYDPRSSPSTNSWVILILFHALLVLQQWALLAAIFSDPGQVPRYWGFRMGDAEAKRRRYCLMCHAFKPERSHHCSALLGV
jgi:palmitoyltransferase